MKYIEFYEKYKIIPVLKLSDHKLSTILEQRKNFYESLNINTNYLNNFEVLELCPGSGVNSLYLLKNGIKKLTIVDYNSESIKTCKKTLGKYKNKINIINKNIYNFKSSKKYDLVICENTLPGLDNPEIILKKMIRLTKKNGFLILTCSDEVSLFSEKIRGFISKIILDNKSLSNSSLEEKIKELKQYFKSHLLQLNTKTRTIESWLIDNLIYEDWWSKQKYFSISDVYNILEEYTHNKCYFWQTSPQFNNNYQWYKKRDTDLINKNLKKQYYEKILNFLDTKNCYKDIKYSREIIFYIKNTCELINKKSYNKNILNKISNNLKKISYYLKKNSKDNTTSIAIDNIVFFLNDYINSGVIMKKYIKKLSFWGYGTQQICLKMKNY
tara:strand:+ start:3515 stop:4666 length:1152 start_codon:yes stop_codon:yes gene_type:complete